MKRTFKNMQVKKDKIKLFVHRSHNHICTISEIITQSILELVNDYSKISGYMINAQKSITFLYIINEQVVFEIKIQYHKHWHPSKLKYSGINLTKIYTRSL